MIEEESLDFFLNVIKFLTVIFLKYDDLAKVKKKHVSFRYCSDTLYMFWHKKLEKEHYLLSIIIYTIERVI